jgi:hypothetical protein
MAKATESPLDALCNAMPKQLAESAEVTGSTVLPFVFAVQA